MPFSTHQKPADAERSEDAQLLGVETVLYVDLPLWWCRLTAPVALSWKRQAALLVGLPFGGFMLGFVFAMRIPA